MNTKEELLFCRFMDLKTQLAVGYYGYGRRGRKYNEVQEALVEVRRRGNMVRERPYSERRGVMWDFNEFEDVWGDFC